jgi:hypothetical protein
MAIALDLRTIVSDILRTYVLCSRNKRLRVASHINLAAGWKTVAQFHTGCETHQASYSSGTGWSSFGYKGWNVVGTFVSSFDAEIRHESDFTSTCNLPACSVGPQPTTLPRAPKIFLYWVLFCVLRSFWKCTTIFLEMYSKWKQPNFQNYGQFCFNWFTIAFDVYAYYYMSYWTAEIIRPPLISGTLLLLLVCMSFLSFLMLEIREYYKICSSLRVICMKCKIDSVYSFTRTYFISKNAQRISYTFCVVSVRNVY